MQVLIWHEKGIEYDGSDGVSIAAREPPELYDRLPEWPARVSKAIYRAMIINATLAGAHGEPFFDTMQDPRRELREGFADDSDCFKFLAGYAPFNHVASSEANDGVYGRISDWLVDSVLADSEGRSAMSKRFEQGIGRGRFCHGQLPLCPVNVCSAVKTALPRTHTWSCGSFLR